MNLEMGGGACPTTPRLRRDKKVGYALSLHDVFNCPPSLRDGEVQWASWMKAIILILLRLSGYGGTGLSFTFGAL